MLRTARKRRRARRAATTPKSLWLTLQEGTEREAPGPNPVRVGPAHSVRGLFGYSARTRDALRGVAPPFTVIDGGEVNTSITVESLIQSTETGLVTVSIEGVTPAAASALLDVILVIDESGSVDAVENELVVAAARSFLETMDQSDGIDDNGLTGVRIGVVRYGSLVNLAPLPTTTTTFSRRSLCGSRSLARPTPMVPSRRLEPTSRKRRAPPQRPQSS